MTAITPISARNTARQCSNCNRAGFELKRGRCNSCAQWFRTYNEERPLDAADRAALKRMRLLPDDAVREVHARYMAGDAPTTLAREAGVSRITLWRRFADLGLERREEKTRPCSVCGRILLVNEHGKCRSCASAATRWRCPRCGIVVPAELAPDDVCDMCRDDMERHAARWRPHSKFPGRSVKIWPVRPA